MAVFRGHANVVFPLMSQLCLDDATWRLLDSGASATVIAERYAKVYGVSAMCAGSGDDQFIAANGLRSTLKAAEIGLKFPISFLGKRLLK